MRMYAYACVVLATLGSGVSVAAEQPVEVERTNKAASAVPGAFVQTRVAAVAYDHDEVAQGSAVEPAIEPPAPKPAAKPAAKPLSPSLKVSVNLSTQRMTVTENGKVVHTWAISSGREGFRTPTGAYRPQWMSPMHYSKKYDNAPMPHSVFYHGGYAIHATYATKALGRPASHGCIRLAPAHAKTFYHLVEKHGKERTRIAVNGVAPAAVAKASGNTQKVASSADWTSPNKPVNNARPKPAAPQKIHQAQRKIYVWPGDQPTLHRPSYGSATYSY